MAQPDGTVEKEDAKVCWETSSCSRHTVTCETIIPTVMMTPPLPAILTSGCSSQLLSLSMGGIIFLFADLLLFLLVSVSHRLRMYVKETFDAWGVWTKRVSDLDGEVLKPFSVE